MARVASNIIEYAMAMNRIGFKYSYKEVFYIRQNGVDCTPGAVAAHNDKIVAVVTVRYDKDANDYTIEKQNE